MLARVCPPAPSAEVTQLVAQNEVATPRFERVAVLVGLASFLSILAVGLALYLAEFQVASWVSKAAGYGVAVGFVLWLKWTTPTSKLTPTERSVRARRRVAALIGLLGSISVLGSIVVAYSLHTWVDYLRLFFTATAPIGFGLLINVRFGMGSK